MSTVSVTGRTSNYNRSWVGICAIKASRFLRGRMPDQSIPPKKAKAMLASFVRSATKTSGDSVEVSKFFS